MSTPDETLSAPAADEAPQGLSIFDIFETDTGAEEDGRWLLNYFGERAQGDVKIRGFTSSKSKTVRKRLDALYHRHLRQDGTYPEDVAVRFMIEQLAEAIIVDWRGEAFRDREGKPIPFSPAVAKELMTKMPHFRNRLVVSAGQLDNFRLAEQEAIEKN